MNQVQKNLEVKSIINGGEQKLLFRRMSYMDYRKKLKTLVEEFDYLQQDIYYLKDLEDAMQNHPQDLIDIVDKIQILTRNKKRLVTDIEMVLLESLTGRWLLDVKGISSVTAAKLLVFFDVNKAFTAGHFWNYCGLNNNNRKVFSIEESEKIIYKVLGQSKIITDKHLDLISKETKWDIRYLDSKCKLHDGRSITKLTRAIACCPFNMELKLLCNRIGDYFAELEPEHSIYNKMYIDRLQFEMERGECVDQLHCIRRSKRYATKLFISHLFECCYLDYNKEDAPNPYSIKHDKGYGYIGPDNNYRNYI